MKDTYYPVQKEINILGIHALYYRENDRDFYFKNTRLNCWRIIYVDKGGVSVSANNRSYFLRQGDMIFHEPYETHALASNGKDKNRIFIINFEAEGDGMEKLRNKVYSLNPYQQDKIKQINGEAKHIFTTENKMLVMIPDTRYGSLQLVAAAMEKLFIDIIRWGKPRDFAQESAGARHNIELVLAQSVQEYMAAHLTENLSLMDICEHFHVGKTYLSAVFKGQTGRSIIDYYIGLKINKGKELLENTNLSIASIAEQLGFSGGHHFTRTFKTKTGISPSEYKKTHGHNR